MSQISCCQLQSPNPTIRDVQTEHDADVSRLLLTAPLVLAYLILDDMYDLRTTNARYLLIYFAIRPPARFALTRLPSPLLHHPPTEGLFNLLASTSERNYSQVYVRAKALAETLNADPDLNVFGPSMVKTFVGENGVFHARFPSHPLHRLQKLRSELGLST